MSERTTTANTIARERVDTLANRNSEPAWLRELRLGAWEAYLQTPMPSSRDEEWRKVEFEALNFSALKTVDFPGGAAAAAVQAGQPSDLPGWFQQALARFDQRSGVVTQTAKGTWSDLSDEARAKGVIFCSLKTALEKHHELVRPHLEKQLSHDGKFGLMNKALFNSGTFLYLPPNVEVEGVFLSLVHVGAPDVRQGIAVFPRLIIVAGANSKANIASFLSTDDGAAHNEPVPLSLVDASIEIYVGAGAKLSYLELHRFDRRTFAVARNHNEVAKDGYLYSLTSALGAYQLKSDISTFLNAAGAQTDIEGVVLGAKSEHFSFNTVLEHNAPDCKSNINFRVALKDAASSVYMGTIRVAKAAQKTDALQSNKNLLLGAEAKADSIPKLEILADDVKCAHGATVGPVDKEQLFYLTSRGLTPPQAEELIVTGFFRKVFDTCKIPGATDYISELLGEKIHEES